MKTLGRWDSRNQILNRSLSRERENRLPHWDELDALVCPASSATNGMEAATGTAPNESARDAASWFLFPKVQGETSEGGPDTRVR
jgi:hypothetical protein